VVPPTALAVAREGAEAILRSARPLFYTTLEEAWDHAQAGTSSTLEQKAESRWPAPTPLPAR
jgi:hypothetical protein